VRSVSILSSIWTIYDIDNIKACLRVVGYDLRILYWPCIQWEPSTKRTWFQTFHYVTFPSISQRLLRPIFIFIVKCSKNFCLTGNKWILNIGNYLEKNEKLEVENSWDIFASIGIILLFPKEPPPSLFNLRTVK
jgi:hypothetical protein